MSSQKRLSALITIGGAVSGSLKSALGTTRSKLLEVGDAIDKVRSRQKELNRTIAEQERLGRAGSALRVQYAHQELSDLDKRLAKLRQVHAATKALHEAGQANLARRSELRSRLGDAFSIGAAVVLPSVGALRQSAAFNHELQLIGNTADMTREDVLQLGADIMRVSKDAGQSVDTVRQAMGHLIAAGMKPDVARAMLLDLGRTATASEADIADLAAAAFTLNDTLGVAPGQAMRDAIDSLAQAGKEGNVELRDMAKALPVLGAGFKALKVEGREGAATMGAMLQIARKGAATADQAATNFENFLGKVTSPETRKKAAKMGLDISKVVKDAQKAGQNPLEAAIKAIAKVTEGDQEKIGDLFQDMQVASFIRPMLQNWEEYERIKLKALGASGVVDRDFSLMSETTLQQAREAGSAFGRLAVVIGTALEPAVSSVLRVITPVVGAIADWVQAHPNLTAGLLLTAGAVATLTVGGLALGYAFTFVRGGFLGLKAVLLAAQPVIAWLGATALPMVGRAILFIGRALLLNPIGLAVTGIAAAAFLIWKNWEPLKAWFSQLWADITATFNQALEWITTKIDWIGEKWRQTKAFFGFSEGEGPAAAGVATAPKPPELPASAAGRGGVTVQRQGDTYHITQQPGQDAKALADEISKRQRQRDEAARRGTMYDAIPEGAW